MELRYTLTNDDLVSMSYELGIQEPAYKKRTRTSSILNGIIAFCLVWALLFSYGLPLVWYTIGMAAAVIAFFFSNDYRRKQVLRNISGFYCITAPTFYAGEYILYFDNEKIIRTNITSGGRSEFCLNNILKIESCKDCYAIRTYFGMITVVYSAFENDEKKEKWRQELEEKIKAFHGEPAPVVDEIPEQGLHYTITNDSIVTEVYDFTIRSLSYRRNLTNNLIYRGTLNFIFFFIVFYQIFDNPNTYNLGLGMVSLLSVLITLVLTLIGHRTAYSGLMRATKSRYSSAAPNSVAGEILLYRDDEKLFYTNLTSGYKTEGRIDHIKRIEQGRDFLHITFNSTFFFLVPYSAFEDTGKMSEFIDRLRVNTGSTPVSDVKPDTNKHSLFYFIITIVIVLIASELLLNHWESVLPSGSATSSQGSSVAAEQSYSLLPDTDLSRAIALDTPGGYGGISAGMAGFGSSSFVMQNGLIFIKSVSGENLQSFVSCFQTDGKKLWELSFNGSFVRAWPLQDNSCLIYSANSNALIHVKPNGWTDWQKKCDSSLKDCMVQPDGTVLYLDNSQHLGKVLPDGSMKQTASVPRSIMIMGGFIPFSGGGFGLTDNSALYCYNASCEKLWSYSVKDDGKVVDAIQIGNGDTVVIGYLATGDAGIWLLDQRGKLLKEKRFPTESSNVQSPLSGTGIENIVMASYGGAGLIQLHDGTIAVFPNDHVFLLDTSLNIRKDILVNHYIPISNPQIFQAGLTALDNGGFAVNYASGMIAFKSLTPFAILRAYQYDQNGEPTDRQQYSFQLANAFPNIFIDANGQVFYENPPGMIKVDPKSIAEKADDE